jgi:hypothetical protein
VNRVHSNAGATTVAMLHLRLQRVHSLRAILDRLRAQVLALTGAESFLDPSTPDFNPQVVNTANSTLDQAQTQLRALSSTLAGEPNASPFTRPLRRLGAAAGRLQDAATNLQSAVIDLQAGRASGVATDLAGASDALRRARNALNRTQVLLSTICADRC